MQELNETVEKSRRYRNLEFRDKNQKEKIIL